jgi:hypothetical protein
MQKFVYFLRVDVHDCGYNILVNGMKLRRDNNGYPIITEFPINEFLVSPKVKVEINLFPIVEEQFLRDEASCTLSLISTVDGVKNSRMIVSESKTLNIQPKAPSFDQTFLFNLELPDFSSTLKNILPLQKSDLLNERIIKIYRDFYSALEKKSVSNILLLTQIRDKDFANAYFVNQQFRSKDVEETFLNYFGDPNLELLGLSFEGYFLKFYHDGKICCFEDVDGDPPLVYVNNKEDSVILLQLFIGQNSSGELIIIR